MLLTELVVGDHRRRSVGEEKNPHPPRPWRLKASEGKMPSGQQAGRRRYKARLELVKEGWSLEPRA